MGLIKWISGLWQGLVIGEMNLIHREMDPEASKRVSIAAGLLMCWVAVILTLLEYYGHSGSIFYRWFLSILPKKNYFSPLYRHMYWSLSASVAYFVLPAIVITLTPGDRIRNYGTRLKGMSQHLWIYMMLYLTILPAVVFVSYFSSFQRTYPFYSQASRSFMDLGLWWIFYGLQFFTLEFFFRGYILHGLKKHVGALAIFFSAVPYCMIHFGKPMPETLGAIIAGIALGILSLRTLSVWSGFLIHISVAFTMDLLSLWQKGQISIFM